MHVLGHSFSQKRKASKRPRDLHIRKVSFSGSSLSGASVSSSDSSSSDSTASACTVIMPPQYASQAPPRLHERPLKDISPQRPRFETGSFFNDNDSDASSIAIMDSDEGDYDDENLPHFTMEMPPGAVYDAEEVDDTQLHPDYFAFQLASRPSMPGSRWSESTIQSVQTIDAFPTPGSRISTAITETGDDECPPVMVEMPPNYAQHSRAVSTPVNNVSAPVADGRPQMRTMDSIDEFVKRHGWKRRGVIFRENEIDPVVDDI